MNLITFHRVLIGAAALFFAGYGVWEAWRWFGEPTPMRLVFVSGAFAAAAVLLLYLTRIDRFLKPRR